MPIPLPESPCFSVTGNYIQQQVETWTKQYRAMETHVIPAMERLIEWLPLHFPESQKTTVVHGDFRYHLADSTALEHIPGGREGECKGLFKFQVDAELSWCSSY